MTCAAQSATIRCTIADTLSAAMNRALFAAFLLTADAAQAERAVSAALELWEPPEEDENQLIRQALSIAARNARPANPNAGSLNLPEELEPVLNLPAQLRACYVLRILAGLAPTDCAKLLGISQATAVDYTIAAFERLKPKQKPQ